MIEIKISQRVNGYTVETTGGLKYSGTYVFRSLDILTMLCFLGSIVLGKKVKIEEE